MGPPRSTRTYKRVPYRARFRSARNLCEDVEWTPEDGTRTEHDFLCRCVESAITAGAGTINIPDTVGYTIPEEFAALIAMLKNRGPNIDKAVISVHCHKIGRAHV